MTGHQQLVNDVKFSPDSRLIASASFDKSIKIWDGRTGNFITTLRGHVQAVYQISWSADSRLLVSGSADSTLKGRVWIKCDIHLIWELMQFVFVFNSSLELENKKVAFGLARTRWWSICCWLEPWLTTSCFWRTR